MSRFKKLTISIHPFVVCSVAHNRSPWQHINQISSRLLISDPRPNSDVLDILRMTFVMMSHGHNLKLYKRLISLSEGSLPGGGACILF